MAPKKRAVFFTAALFNEGASGSVETREHEMQEDYKEFSRWIEVMPSFIVRLVAVAP